MTKDTDRILVALAGVLFAVGLLYVAVPRAVATLHALDGQAAATSVYTGQYIGREELRELAVSRAAAFALGGDPVHAGDLARTYYALIRTEKPENRLSLVTAAYEASISELTARPMNAIAWWRLSILENMRAGGPTREAARFLLRSLQVQPNSSTVAFTKSRLQRILYNWWRFEPAGRREVTLHVANLWPVYRKLIVGMATNEMHRGIFRAALSVNPQFLGQFEAALLKAKPRR